MATKISPMGTMTGFNWKTFLLGFKKPAVTLITMGIGAIGVYPEATGIIAALGGSAIVVERIWALIEFYVKDIKLK